MTIHLKSAVAKKTLKNNTKRIVLRKYPAHFLHVPIKKRCKENDDALNQFTRESEVTCSEKRSVYVKIAGKYSRKKLNETFHSNWFSFLYFIWL